jgi:hypothetical protein
MVVRRQIDTGELAMKVFKTRAAMLLVALLFGSTAHAQQCSKKAICTLVKTTKKVEVVCYGCKCEDICIPGRAKKGCTHGGGCRDCAARGKSCSCDQKPICKFRWTEWTATTSKSKTRKKLVKYIVVREIPSYRWVIVKPEAAGGNSDVPPPPPTTACRPPFGTVVVAIGTKLPPLPPGITPDQVRGVVFQGSAKSQPRRPAAESQPRLILR